MTDDGISESVRQFIFESLDSVEMLDVLLLLNSCREKDWSAQDVSDELRTNPVSAANRLARLKIIGFLMEKPGPVPSYRYSPHSEYLAKIADGLVVANKVRRHKILELIFSPLKKARTIANAFRLVKKGDESE